MKEQIIIRILELVNKPVRAEIVYATLAAEFIAATKEEIHSVVHDMILRSMIIELEYRMDDEISSIFFPIKCDIYLKFNNGFHSFVRPKK